MTPIAALAFCLGILATAAQAQTPAAAEKVAIQRILDNEVASWNKGDAHGFARDVLPDCVFTNVVGMVAVGRPGFEAQHRKIFATIYKGSTITLTVTHLRAIAPGVIIVDTDARVQNARWRPSWAEFSNGAPTARLEQVMVKDHGNWGITSFHNVFIARPNA